MKEQDIHSCGRGICKCSYLAILGIVVEVITDRLKEEIERPTFPSAKKMLVGGRRGTNVRSKRHKILEIDGRTAKGKIQNVFSFVINTIESHLLQGVPPRS